MPKPENDTPARGDEFSRIFSEYRARIDEISRRTEKRLKSLNTDQADAASAVVSPPEEPPEDLKPAEAPPVDWEEEETPAAPSRSSARPHPGAEVPVPEQFAGPESAAAIREARREAKRIVQEAEEKVKREARKKTQSQVDRLLERAKKESDDIIARSRQAAEQEKNDIISIARHEAEQALADITEKCRRESREKAQKIMAEVIASGTEINRLIIEIIDRAGKTLAEFESRLREETGDLTRIITETRARLEEVTIAASEDHIPPAAQDTDVALEEITGPSLTVRLLGEKSNGLDGSPVLFHGQVEMKSSTATDYQYLKSVKKYLVGMPDVKYLQEYASEKEMSVLFDIREPMPLLDILRQGPLVEDIVTGSDEELSILFRTD
jgi:hypothetical protein